MKRIRISSLVERTKEWKRAALREPRVKYQVIGERCSGTNFTRALIQANFKLRQHQEMVWKHGFPSFLAAPDDAVFVVVFREAFGWLESMYAKPWHTAAHIRELPFSEFIRTPWESTIDAKEFPRFHASNPRVGKPLNLDLHPISGEPFENILALRRAKIEALLSLPKRGARTLFITHSQISSDPESFIKDFAEITGVSAGKDLDVPSKHFGFKWEDRKVRKDEESLINDADHQFIVSNLDFSLEKKAQLTYNLPDRSDS